jgi:threonine synthase
MRFKSSRNSGHTATLIEAIERGLAPDGGLYVPEILPRLDVSTAPAKSAAAANHGVSNPLWLSAMAGWVLEPFFAGDLLEPALQDIARMAFNFPAPVTPVRGAPGPLSVLELFHGPTAAFKDFGARFLAGCLERRRGDAKRRLTILVATSGDTGGAVAAAFHRRPWAEVIVLFPKGLVSPRQEQQLTCWDGNVRTFAVKGTFDDCQRMVKAAFLNPEIRAVRDLSSANSINIGRLLPQLAYYAAASLDISMRTGGPASFIVPSGNLGNVMACIWAREMGLPIEEIILAHNRNRTVPDFLETGRWQPRPSVATLASAMDVGDPSNMERVRAQYPGFATLRERISAVSVTDAQIKERISADLAHYGRIWCPHTATAAAAYAQLPPERQRAQHWVLVATAHPAKFSETIEPLIGKRIEVPQELAALLALPTRCMELEADFGHLKRLLNTEAGLALR